MGRYRCRVPRRFVRALVPAVVAVVCLACASTSGTTSVHSPGSTGSGATAVTSSPGSASATAPAPSPAVSGSGASGAPTSLAPVAGPLPGDLLIADRGNDRLLIVTPDKRIVWSMTIDPGGPRGSQSWGPDDAFFTPDGRHIIVNQENAHTIAVIDIATKRIVWQYGHTGVPGPGPGYLNGPDDAYMLPDGTVTVADIRNERVLFISPAGTIVRQYGLSGQRRHDPPVSYAAPNGDVPLADGGMLVTEIGGSWADRLDAAGHVVWSIHLRGVAYPSDAQLLPDGNVLVVDYATPGAVEEVTPAGHVVWRYAVPSGPTMLAHPSLAVRLANGNVAVTSDFSHTVVVIDPRTNRIVWRYGHDGIPGSAPGYLFVPDGLDPVPAAAEALLAGGPLATATHVP